MVEMEQLNEYLAHEFGKNSSFAFESKLVVIGREVALATAYGGVKNSGNAGLHVTK